MNKIPIKIGKGFFDFQEFYIYSNLLIILLRIGAVKKTPGEIPRGFFKGVGNI